MKDQFTDEDGNEITCRMCDVTAREFFTQDKFMTQRTWMIGPNWYCGDSCYEEATKDEG